MIGCTEGVSIIVFDGGASDRGASGDDTTNDVSIELVRPNNSCGASPWACNPLDGSGCSTGLSCAVFDPVRHESRCVTLGTGGWGARCSSTTPCRDGFVCSADPAQPSLIRCVKLCCPGDDAWCADTNSGGLAGGVCGDSFVAGDTLSYCVLPCDPLMDSNECPRDSQYCAIGERSGLGICIPFNTNPPRMIGQRCAVINDCQTGATCIAYSSTSLCRRVCDPTNSRPSSCSVGQRCISSGGARRDVGHCE